MLKFIFLLCVWLICVFSRTLPPFCVVKVSGSLFHLSISWWAWAARREAICLTISASLSPSRWWLSLLKGHTSTQPHLICCRSFFPLRIQFSLVITQLLHPSACVRRPPLLPATPDGSKAVCPPCHCSHPGLGWRVPAGFGGVISCVLQLPLVWRVIWPVDFGQKSDLFICGEPSALCAVHGTVRSGMVSAPEPSCWAVVSNFWVLFVDIQDLAGSGCQWRALFWYVGQGQRPVAFSITPTLLCFSNILWDSDWERCLWFPVTCSQ